jgi:glycerophosphoryl diester phosphodiesterase
MALLFSALDDLSFACIGHRGACGYAAENTLASFQLAIEMGCPWIELDVYYVDGELLVIHDDDLERTTNGQGKVMDQSLSYLRSLDAGDNQKIPTLQEVIELVDHKAGINIELKGPDTATAVVKLINQFKSRGWHTDEFFLSSFRHKELQKTYGLDKTIRLGALFGRIASDPIARAQQFNAFSINISSKSVAQELVERSHDAGLKVYVYTVNDPAEIARMLTLNIDGVFTNYPDRVFAEIEKT